MISSQINFYTCRTIAGLEDFEFSRDRIMMGIERKKLYMTDRERLNTAIHEAGHATACYFTKGARKLYKATIVARGGSLGATFMVPDDAESLAMDKEKVLAHIDVAMGGHVAERLFLGDKKVTSGCGSDLQGATKIAYMAVRKFGMFGEEGAGYLATEQDETSEKYNAMVDAKVKKILDVRVLLGDHVGVVRTSAHFATGKGGRGARDSEESLLVRLPLCRGDGRNLREEAPEKREGSRMERRKVRDLLLRKTTERLDIF